MLYTLVHFALFNEAQPLINHLNAKLINRLKTIQLFKADNTFIIVSGSGYINTCNAIAFTHLTNQEIIHNAICINLGIAASYNIPLYTWNYANEIIDFNNQKKFYPDIFIKENSAGVYSVSKAVNSKITQQYANKIFDMEAFAFAKSCKFYQPNHHIHIAKFISDKGDLNIDTELVFKHYSNSIVPYFKNLLHAVSNVLTMNNAYNKIIPDQLIQQISEKMRLTFYQKQQLQQALTFYLNFHSIENINKVLSVSAFKHKKDKNKQFQNLLTNLYAL